MGHQYLAIGWNRQKKRYDLLIVLFVLLYLVTFAGLTLQLTPDITAETLIIRSTGSLAITILHVILVIGPICRVNPFFLPLLYNRRHLGVTMSIIALVHGLISIMQFHSLGNVSPHSSLFISNHSKVIWASSVDVDKLDVL